MSNSIFTDHGSGDRIRPMTSEERLKQLQAMNMPGDWAARKLAEEEKEAAEIAKHMSPPGGIPGLPPLLEKKRLAYGITDHFFRFQALFDRVFLYQIHEGDGQTYGGIIQMTDDQKKWEREMAPQGILLSAGLKALDSLRSYGVELGHTVMMNKLTPYHFRVGFVAGHEIFCLVARDGDLVGSLETMGDIRERRCAIVSQVLSDDDGVCSYQHVLKDREGKLWAPSDPWISDDQ